MISEKKESQIREKKSQVPCFSLGLSSFCFVSVPHTLDDILRRCIFETCLQGRGCNDRMDSLIFIALEIVAFPFRFPLSFFWRFVVGGSELEGPGTSQSRAAGRGAAVEISRDMLVEK